VVTDSGRAELCAFRDDQKGVTMKYVDFVLRFDQAQLHVRPIVARTPEGLGELVDRFVQDLGWSRLQPLARLLQRALHEWGYELQRNYDATLAHPPGERISFLPATRDEHPVMIVVLPVTIAPSHEYEVVEQIVGNWLRSRGLDGIQVEVMTAGLS
jgi:hypothetical protein